MNPLVYLVMFGWIPAVFYFFNRFSPQKAVVVSFIVAWLFLPQASFVLPGIPDYHKMSATCYGIVFATLANDFQRISQFRFRWIDIPIAVWCGVPFVTSMTNGLGAYDGLTAVLDQSVTWGVPYFLGRLYLGNLAGMKQLAIGILWGGLAYAPLCLLETRISPQLHRLVYGYHAFADFSQSMRMGGFRPTVFMAHGLMVAGWMMAATLVAVWLWQAKVLNRVRNIQMKWVVIGLVITFIMLKSTGAYALLLVGVGAMFLAKRFRTGLLMFFMVGLIVFYLNTSASGALSVKTIDQITVAVQQVAGEERAASLRFRLDNEQILSERARLQPLFGWGGWGRNRVFDEEGKDISVTDSLWIIAFGIHGYVGLISLFSTMLVPPLAFTLLKYPARYWMHPKVAPAAAIAVILVLFAFDCVLNAMTNPVFTLAMGGMAGLAVNDPGPTITLRRKHPAARKQIPRKMISKAPEPVSQ
jgi:hypothetical protein